MLRLLLLLLRLLVPCQLLLCISIRCMRIGCRGRVPSPPLLLLQQLRRRMGCVVVWNDRRRGALLISALGVCLATIRVRGPVLALGVLLLLLGVRLVLGLSLWLLSNGRLTAAAQAWVPLAIVI